MKHHYMNPLAALCLMALAAMPVAAQQHKCSSHSNYISNFANDPAAAQRRADLEAFTRQYAVSPQAVRNVIRIPVVVHVVYNTPDQNVSDAQIHAQIDVLNEDFRNINTNRLNSGDPFYAAVGDAEIEFCLADTDPDGNPTNGITRTSTTVTSFSSSADDVKDPSKGGVANWDPTRYLNMYVCELDGTTLGYASFPSELATDPEKDGIAIRPQAFGKGGTAGGGSFTENDLGRTATHEVGHWLNLFHIWGDAVCGDDEVADTPVHEDDEGNSGCPSFPFNANSACGTDANGEMYMNYMDYTDDNCMAMFSKGQVTRMRAALAGPRAALMFSDGCSGIANVDAPSLEKSLHLYPNPASDLLSIRWTGAIAEIQIINLQGSIQYKANLPGNIRHQINLEAMPAGYYFLRATIGGATTTRAFSINK